MEGRSFGEFPSVSLALSLSPSRSGALSFQMKRSSFYPSIHSLHSLHVFNDPHMKFDRLLPLSLSLSLFLCLFFFQEKGGRVCLSFRFLVFFFLLSSFPFLSSPLSILPLYPSNIVLSILHHLLALGILTQRTSLSRLFFLSCPFHILFFLPLSFPSIFSSSHLTSLHLSCSSPSLFSPTITITITIIIIIIIITSSNTISSPPTRESQIFNKLK